MEKNVNKINKNLIEKNEWDYLYNQIKIDYNKQEIKFHDIFKKYIIRNSTIFEIGCYPGGYLKYFAENFSATIGGVDSTSSMYKMLEHFNEKKYKIGLFENKDLFELTINQKFDVVCSFGFVEHFTDFEIIIKKHIDIVELGGVLIITMPSFRYMQYVIRKILNPNIFLGHNINAMELSALEKIIKEYGCEVLESGYYETCAFWYEPKGMKKIQKLINTVASKILNGINKIINLPNKYTSPYLYIVARKINAVN